MVNNARTYDSPIICLIPIVFSNYKLKEELTNDHYYYFANDTRTLQLFKNAKVDDAYMEILADGLGMTTIKLISCYNVLERGKLSINDYMN